MGSITSYLQLVRVGWVFAREGVIAALPADDLPPVGQIEVRPPPNLTDRSGRDWEKVVDKIYNGEYDKALRELDKWERKYGEREETQYLRAQLERLPQLDEE